MKIQIKMEPLRREDSIRAVGTVSFGEIGVRNITLMENKDGELFLVMPNRNTGKKDHTGHNVYEEIAHPITKELRYMLNDAALESYKESHPVTLRDKVDGQVLVQVEAFETPFYNRVGRGQLLINEMFVIKDIYINKTQTGNLYISWPNFKTNKVSKSGKPIFSEVISMSAEFKKSINEALIKEYNLEKKYKEQNRISIKSRIEEAKIKVCGQDSGHKNKIVEATL